MATQRDHPTERPFFVDPSHRVGGALHRIGKRSPHESIPVAAGFATFLGCLVVAGELPDPLGWVAVIAGIAAMFGGMFASQLAGEQLCPACEYPQSDDNRYCASCGSGLEVIE